MCVLVYRISTIYFYFHQSNYTIQFLWVPSRIEIHGNNISDSNIRNTTSNFINPCLTLLPWTDFTPISSCHITIVCSSHRINLPADITSRFKNIFLNNLNKTWFKNLSLSTSLIVYSNRLQMSNSLLLVHIFHSSCYTLHLYEYTWNISHILFTYVPLSNKLLILLNSLMPFNIPFNLPFIVDTYYKIGINIIT